MSEPASLLPDNATPLMRAVSEVGASRSVASGPLEHLWDPARAPVASLPYLAAAHGVSVWRPDWSEERKREVIARTIQLKRRRGTIPCFEGHLAFVDAELVQVVRPPNRAVVRSSMTEAERQAWLSQFPELRVHYFRRRSRQPGTFQPGRWPPAMITPRESRADQFAGWHATIVRDGVETPVVARGDGDLPRSLRIALPTRGRRLTPGLGSLGRVVPRASDAIQRLFTFRTERDGPDSLRPSLTAIDVRPERVSGRRIGYAGAVAGIVWSGPFRFPIASRAGEGVYDSLRLFDPSLALAGKLRPRAGFTPGVTRLGQPAFHLELAVDLSFRRRRVKRLPNVPGFVEAFDPSRVDETLAAVRSAKLGRDKVELRTGLHRRITAGDGVPLNGTARLGQIIRSL